MTNDDLNPKLDLGLMDSNDRGEILIFLSFVARFMFEDERGFWISPQMLIDWFEARLRGEKHPFSPDLLPEPVMDWSLSARIHRCMWRFIKRATHDGKMIAELVEINKALEHLYWEFRPRI